MERNDRPATPEEAVRLTKAGFVADNTHTLTTWVRSASGVSMTTEEALLLVDAEDKRRRADWLVTLVSGGSRSVESAEAILREIEGQRVPQSRCPKCGAVPLADNEDALLCEPCNAWYSRKPLPAGAEAAPERPATDFEISVAMSRQPGPRLRPTLPDDVRFELERDASLFGEGVAVLLHEAWQRIAPTNVVIVKRAARRWKMPVSSDPVTLRDAGIVLADFARSAPERLPERTMKAIQIVTQASAPGEVAPDIRAMAVEVVRQALSDAADAALERAATDVVDAIKAMDAGFIAERALVLAGATRMPNLAIPPAAIPLTAAQLRALAESDEAGDAPFVATASALREMVAAQLGWQVQMPVFDADGTRRAERWTVMVPAAGPAAVPGAILLGIGADEIVERAVQTMASPFADCAVCGTTVAKENRLTHCAAQPGTGVLAVVELETRLSEDRTYRVARAVALPAGAPERVTVAVFVPGSKLARAVEAVQRVEALCERREIEDIMIQGEVVVPVAAVRAALAGEAGAAQEEEDEPASTRATVLSSGNDVVELQIDDGNLWGWMDPGEPVVLCRAPQTAAKVPA